MQVLRVPSLDQARTVGAEGFERLYPVEEDSRDALLWSLNDHERRLLAAGCATSIAYLTHQAVSVAGVDRVAAMPQWQRRNPCLCRALGSIAYRLSGASLSRFPILGAWVSAMRRVDWDLIVRRLPGVEEPH